MKIFILLTFSLLSCFAFGENSAPSNNPDLQFLELSSTKEHERTNFSQNGEKIYLGCCKVCTTGCACGNSCISCSYNCTKPPGCACDG